MDSQRTVKRRDGNLLKIIFATTCQGRVDVWSVTPSLPVFPAQQNTTLGAA